ncbi:MFS transporter [Chloroflexota bacterium]
MVSNTSTRAKANEFRTVDYIKITIFGFALSALWSSLHAVIMPLRLLDFVPATLKNTYLDLLILAGLILAMAVQPITGAISDRSGFGWGRRRPYILLGGILILLFLPGIGLFGSYAAIFAIYCLLQVSSNTAQGPFQGFIPDLVPEGKRGLASGVRSLLNMVGGIALIRLIAPFMDRYFAGEGSPWLWLSLGVPAIVLLGAILATVLTVKERPRAGSPQLPLLTTLYKSFKIDVKARPDFILFLVCCLLIFTAWATLMAHALYYLMDVVGITGPAAAASDLLIVVGICMLAVVYPAGRLSDRIGRKPIAVSSGLLGALGIAALFFSQSYMHVMLSGCLLGICGGAWISSQWALATDMVGKGEEARYLGLANMSIAGAGALSRLTGPMIDFFNAYSPNLGYQVMLLVCFTCLVVGSLLLVKIKAPGLAEGTGHYAS